MDGCVHVVVRLSNQSRQLFTREEKRRHRKREKWVENGGDSVGPAASYTTRCGALCVCVCVCQSTASSYVSLRHNCDTRHSLVNLSDLVENKSWNLFWTMNDTLQSLLTTSQRHVIHSIVWHVKECHCGIHCISHRFLSIVLSGYHINCGSYCWKTPSLWRKIRRKDLQ